MPFISETQPEQQSSAQLQAHTRLFPVNFCSCRGRREGNCTSGRPEELPGAGINRTRRQEPNGGSNRKATFEHQPGGNQTTTQANQCKSESATKIKISHKASHPLGKVGFVRACIPVALLQLQTQTLPCEQANIKNSNSERGNSKFTSAEYMFSLNSCTGNQTFC